MFAWFCSGWVAGCLLTHQLAVLPNTLFCFLAGLFFLVLAFVARKLSFCVLILSAACGLMMGVAWTACCASDRLADSLDPLLEGYVTRVNFLVTSLSKVDPHGQQFDAKLIGGTTRLVPQNLVIHWSGRGASGTGANQRDTVMPGQVWRAALILKRPRSKINPHSFDSEAHLFSRGIRAIGTVRGHPVLISDDPWSSTHTLVQRIRHHIRAAMQRTIGVKRYAPVLIALAVGDQNGVSSDDWKLFNLAGITHLVSISGSHVTLMAALIAKLCLSLWKRAHWRGVPLSSRVPAKTVAGCMAMVTAFLYCLLAGWGVPAQRTFFMLLVAWLAWTSRLRLSAHQVLSLAAFLVSWMDPWSVISTGFWLSFGAVWVLWMAGQSSGRDRRKQRGRWTGYLFALGCAARLQWVISLSLVPILCWLFQQVSVASPLANAVAIPVVTLIVTPASLLLAGLSLVEPLSVISTALAWIAHTAFEWMMVPVGTLATAKWALVEMPAFPIAWLLVAVVGLTWSLQPNGVPARWAGWLWMSAALCWTPARPRSGEWRMLAFDIGQASSVLIMTARQAMLFDAGGRSARSDDGERIVLPVLRSLGIRKLDVVVISHDDRDHVGGLRSILEGIPVQRLVGGLSTVVASDRVQNQLGIHASLSRSICRKGMAWEMDQVRVEAMYPDPVLPLESSSINDPSKTTGSSNLPGPHTAGYSPKSHQQGKQKRTRRNHDSCVLRVSGRHHSVLLPGDITAREEMKLLVHDKKSVDVVLAPHHGSDTSSSAPWVRAMGAKHVIFQSGWLNRFGHPSSQVLARWEGAGAKSWRTDQDGAIWVRSEAGELTVSSVRASRRRYWHVVD